MSGSSLIELQFLSAVRSGNLFIVRQLNLRHPDLNLTNAVSPEGTPAIWSAAFRNETEILQYLIDNDADIDARNANRTTAAYVAAQNGYLEALELLIEAGADLNMRSKWSSTILGVAAQQGQVGIVERVLEEDVQASINAPTDEEGQTPLWVASHDNHLEIVQLLLDQNASIDARDWRGCSPLWAAAQEGNYAVVNELLSRGANANLTNQEGRTALHAAAAFCHSNVAIRLAQEFNLLLITEDHHGLIPADLLCLNQTIDERSLLRMQYFIIPSMAAVRGNKTGAMAGWLIRNTRPLPTLMNGQNLLHVATSFGNKAAVEFLLDMYPELVGAYDNDGRIPYMTIGDLRSLSESDAEEIRLMFEERRLDPASSEDSSSDDGLSNGLVALIVILTTVFCIFVIVLSAWMYQKDCLNPISFHKRTEHAYPNNGQNGGSVGDQIGSFFDSNSTNQRTEQCGSQEENIVAEEEPWKPFNYVHYLNTDNVDITDEVFNLTEYESLQLGRKSAEAASRVPPIQYADEGTSGLQRPVELAEIQPARIITREIGKQEASGTTTTTDSHPDMMMSWSTGPTKDNSVGSTERNQSHRKELNDTASETFTPRMTFMDFEEMQDLAVGDKTQK